MMIATLPEVAFANRYRGSAGVVPHRHVGAELVLVRRGRCRMRVGATILEAGPGDLAVLPARIPHQQDDLGEVETDYAEFSAPAGLFGDRPRTIAVGQDGLAGAWMRQLTEMERSPATEPQRSGLCLALLEHLASVERRTASRRTLHPGVAATLQLMESDLAAQRSVAGLCRCAGLSASHLSALFRQQIGCGPLAWLQRRRLRLAGRLLIDPSRPVAEVASVCGYADANYFARHFRRRFGCTPSEWRRRGPAAGPTADSGDTDP